MHILITLQLITMKDGVAWQGWGCQGLTVCLLVVGVQDKVPFENEPTLGRLLHISCPSIQSSQLQEPTPYSLAISWNLHQEYSIGYHAEMKWSVKEVLRLWRDLPTTPGSKFDHWFFKSDWLIKVAIIQVKLVPALFYTIKKPWPNFELLFYDY